MGRNSEVSKKKNRLVDKIGNNLKDGKRATTFSKTVFKQFKKSNDIERPNILEHYAADEQMGIWSVRLIIMEGFIRQRHNPNVVFSGC